MLTINGKQFAKTDAEFMDSLFTSGNTCVGYYKKTVKGVVLMDMQKNVIGFCKSDNVFTGLVSASKDQSTGKIRYQYGASDALLKLVGFDNLNYSERNNSIIKALTI